jgi:hypothetical protein
MGVRWLDCGGRGEGHGQHATWEQGRGTHGGGWVWLGDLVRWAMGVGGWWAGWLGSSPTNSVILDLNQIFKLTRFCNSQKDAFPNSIFLK